MMYKDLGSIPIFEDIATKLSNNGVGFINPILMLLLYFIAFNIVFVLAKVISKVRKRYKN